MTQLSDYRTQLERLKGQKQAYRKQLCAQIAKLGHLEARSDVLEQMRIAVQVAAQDTQKELKWHLSETVSDALAAVFEDPYEFKVDFVLRRNKMEVDFYFQRLENQIAILEAAGGGSADVAAFALRIAMYLLSKPRLNNTLVIDEPLQNLKGNQYPQLACQLLYDTAEKLGLQLIVVTHESDVVNVANKVIKVTQTNGVSKCHAQDSI